MKTTLVKLLMVISLTAGAVISAHGLIPNDDDGDGVPNDVDLCPAENSSSFDRNGDGCLDEFRGARHIEYWGEADAAFTYVINETGAPNITNGTDITAVQAAVATWFGIADTDFDLVYGGTVTQTVANGLDGINLVTFVDETFPFSGLVLAVGLSTSFESDTTIAGRVYRPGEIFDADMLFNPTQTFKVGGSGPGVDIQSVATHEAGHLVGISHAAIQSSTMYYALPGGLAARSLESDDELVYFKAYGDAAVLAGAKNVHGTVTNGSTSDPVPGAIVYLINSVSGDTTACDYTLPDGTYTFPGVANGNYFVAIHALDATSAIGFIQPGNINTLVEATADVTFAAESFDAAESNTDDPAARTAVTISNGSPVATADIITNIDAVAPFVVSARPAGPGEVAVDGAYVIEFSEAINIDTITPSFSFRDIATDLRKGGNIALIRDDTEIVFTPSPPLDFGTDYRLRFDTNLEDRAGNSPASDYVIEFTTEPEPPVSISSLAPNKGVGGTTVVITGRGFDQAPFPVVMFGGVPAVVTSGTVGRLVVDVPDLATTGPVTVTNADLTVSNSLSFTMLTDAEFARGYESGQTILPAAPNAIAITPSGDYAYIAGVGGAHAVVVNPALIGYLSSTPITYLGGELVDIATTATGTRAYAVSTASGQLVEINTDPTTGLLFNTVLSSRDLGASPKGVVTNPTGNRAFITTDANEIQVWDIQLGSPNYTQQVGAMPAPAGSGFVGSMAITPAGDRLLAITDVGDLAFYDLSAETLLTDISVGFEPRSVTVDPAGERAYVAHDNGEVSVVNVEGNPFQVQDVATGGSVRNLVVTPAATYIYATDRELDNLKIIDLDETSLTFRSVVGDIPASSNPVDVVLSPTGEYAFSVLQGGGEGNTQPRMLVTTIGIGPALEAVAPLHGAVGAQIVLSGRDFGSPVNLESATVDFNGVIASVIAHNPDRVVVAVPPGATSGPVRVRKTFNGETQESNALFFEVFTFGSFPGLRESVLIPADGGDTFSQALVMRPQGDVCFVGTVEGRILAYDTRPGSPTFHQNNGRFLASAEPIRDLAVSADGRALFVAAGAPDFRVRVLTADPNAPLFGEEVQDLGLPSEVSLLEMSPDNKHLLLHVPNLDAIFIYDVTGAADGVTPVNVATLPSAIYSDVEFHPSGLACYLGESFPDAQLRVLNTNVDSVNFGQLVQLTPLPGTPPELAISLSVTPDGAALYALTMSSAGGPPTGSLVKYTLDATGSATSTSIEAVYPGSQLRLVISPRGDTAVRTQVNDNLHLLNLATATDIDAAGSSPTLSSVEFDFDPTGNRLYYTDTALDQLRVFELANPAVLFEISGDGQNGVTGELLSSPVRCRVMDGLEFGFGVPGISVTVSVTSGGGLLKSGEDFVNEMVVATDQDGYVEALWQMGTAGLPQQVTFTAVGLVASPHSFTATSAPDPESLPLTVNEILPPTLANNVSATTAVMVTFSRAVDPSTVSQGTLWVQVQADATKVPVTYGFTDGNRRASMTPSQPLAFNTFYQVVVFGVQTPTGDPVSFFTSGFETGAPPPLALRSISPPSALVGVNVTLSGTGFNSNPAANTVSFNGTAATVVGGDASQLLVRVPQTATSGPVTVTSNATTSNALDFAILIPNQSPIDDVISTIGMGTGVKTCTVTPDGALCYTVSPDGDVVIPVDIEGETTFPAITVGDQPVAIIIHPAGLIAYVANFNSGTVSVIDVDQASPTFNTVLSTITVGLNPADLAVFPDGDRVLVANAGSGDVSVIDGDATSAAYHSVISTVGAGTGTKTVTVSPDGTRLYFGTNTGFVVIDANGYSVISTVGTGTGTKSVTVTPDGTLLFILTTAGTILVVDVSPGSPSENQVISTVGAGTGAKGLTVSPDGTLLYVLLEDSDTVLVIAINVIPGVGAIGGDGTATSFTVQFTTVHEVPVGSDPSFVAFDPSGSGRVFVTNAGDKTLMILNGTDTPHGEITAEIKISPHTLNLNSGGRFVHGEIRLPLPILTADIVRSSIRLQDVISIVPGSDKLSDPDEDGIRTLRVAFDRALFQAILPQGEFVPVTITGIVGANTFKGVDTIRTLRPSLNRPASGEHVNPGTSYTIQWTTPNGFEHQIEAADLHFSSDDGATWTLLADKIDNTGSFNWITPNGYFPQCRIMITLWWDKHGHHDDDVVVVVEGHDPDELEMFGQGMNQDPFIIAAAVAVRLKSFDASVEDGDAVLRWETNYEADMDGFQLVRADAEAGTYLSVNKELIAPKGGPTGAKYEFRDTSIRGNRSYWYKLVEVTPDGVGAQFGPYTVTFRLSNGLEQNVPNPFNPATTIKYSIAQDTDVSLVVYDVAGRQVRSLVNQHQRADVYKVAWDGVNDHGGRVASGMYFYKLVAGKFVQTKKMMLLK